MKLFNSLSQQLEIFKPENTSKVKIYVCGPTVYDRPHLGNVRSIVIYDVLYRLLIEKYGQNNVLYVRNITDVDDKINIAAKQKGVSIKKLTEEMTEYFHQDIAALNCLKPNIEPKATDHIEEMIDMISILINKGNAYLSNNHVYFNVSSFAKYGELSSQDVTKLSAGSRINISEDKKSAEDFVLWKPQDEGDDHSSIFDSPWGKGRPGWHIECSAMSTKYLGHNFDIHGGGADLIFPHHTNEIAQSCSCYPESKYAKYWVHNGFLIVNGEKMSKSLGNFFTVREILDRGIKGETIRYLYLSSHYRKPLNWTQKAIEDAKKSLDSFYRILEAQREIHEEEDTTAILDALSNDLNTSEALSILHDIAKQYNRSDNPLEKSTTASKLLHAGRLLGLFYTTPSEWFKSDIDHKIIESLVSERSQAKFQKNWKKADEIRAKLSQMQVSLEDLPDGSTTWKKL